MSTDVSKNKERKLSKNEILDMETRVEKYKAQGGEDGQGNINPNRAIYINYNTKKEYITYTTYLEVLNRWINTEKPDTIQIYIEPICIDDDDKILPKSTILDMETRVNKFKSQGGTIADTRRIYLSMVDMAEYITYKKYKELISRVETFRAKNNRDPNFVYLRVETNENTTTRVNAVGDDITPNGNGWYLSPRYSTNKNTMRQETNYWCGPNSIQLVWYELTGEIISESYIAKVAGTTTSGTGHTGLETAIKRLAKDKGVNVTITWSYLSDLGYEKLGKLVKDGKTGIFCHNKYKNKYGHYEYIIGINPKTQKLMINNSLSGGWIEYRSFSTMTSYINGITQKSICQVKI